MASIRIDGREVRVRFALWERLAVGRAGVAVPLSAVRDVELVDRPLARTRGGRAGLLVTGVVKVGRWGLGTATRQLVSVRRRVPAVRLGVDRAAAGTRFDELLVSAADAADLVRTIEELRRGAR